MPKTTKSKRTPPNHTRNHTKRHGKHHKKKGGYIKVYAPYLPLIISIILSLLISFWQPHTTNTLAYATNMNTAGLLSSTNAQRTNHGRAALKLNTQLANAAQAKANHMIAHNYWSHVTPDGQEPWVFIQNAGYAYNKAGENLAYGFATSADTIIGWMNSPTHKANMLDSTFTEVGFGFANGSNFNGDGQQTVVVAMYGQPQALAAAAPASPPATPKPAPAPVTSAPAATQPTETAAEKQPAEEPVKQAAPVTTERPVVAAAPVSQNIARAQTLTNGHAPWTLGAAILITGLATIVLLMRHSLKVRHLIKDAIHDTEKFVLHHPFLDSLLLGLIILGAALSRTSGTIL